MGRIFLSLYAFIALSLILLSALLESLFFESKHQPVTPVSAVVNLLEAANQENMPLHTLLNRGQFSYREINQQSIAWHASDLAKLNSKHAVLLFDEQAGNQVFIKDENNILFEITLQQSEVDSIPLYLYSSIFYLLLGLVLLAWVWPLWRDLKRLKHAAEDIQPDGSIAHAKVGKHSLVQPIAFALNTMSKKITLLMKSQSELTGAVAHEFRTPLARLKFALAMIPNAKAANVDAMQQDVSELEKLVQEMLSYTSMEVQLPEMNMSEIPLNTLCNNIVERLRPTINESIQVTVVGDPVMVTADAHFLERAIENLLVNASRYATNKINLVAVKTSKEITIQVEDDGVGIDESLREKVFEPFYRPDESRARQRGGAGLGLAIVRRIMEWHNGRCWVETADIGGARFVLTFPVTSNSD